MNTVTKRATRLIDLYEFLRASTRGHTLEELAERYGVTERTIRRDLADLERDPIYAPIVCDVRHEWRLRDLAREGRDCDE